MSGPNKLIEQVEHPPKDVTEELNEAINDMLEPYGGRQRTLWLFLLATKYYVELSGEDTFELKDYQIAAEMVMQK
jgi:hypothetical protein